MQTGCRLWDDILNFLHRTQPSLLFVLLCLFCVLVGANDGERGMVKEGEGRRDEAHDVAMSPRGCQMPSSVQIHPAMIVHRPPNGSSTMVASRHVSRGERILSVPLRCTLGRLSDGAHGLHSLARELAQLMSAATSRQSEVAMGAAGEEAGFDNDAVLLLLILLRERAYLRHGRETVHSSYVSSLPNVSSMHSPLLWCDAQISLLQATGVVEMTRLVQTKLSLLHRALVEKICIFEEIHANNVRTVGNVKDDFGGNTCERPQTRLGNSTNEHTNDAAPDFKYLELRELRDVSYFDVVEAWLLMASRSFHIHRRTDGGGSRSETGRGEVLMVPLLDMIDHCSVSSAGGTSRAGSTTCQCSIGSTCSSSSSSSDVDSNHSSVDGLRAKKGGGGWVRALEPRQHIGRRRRNSAHAALAGNTWYIEEDSGGESGGRVVLVAGQPYRRGAEICHTYSRALSASAYMLRYGFVPLRTAARAWLPLDIPEVRVHVSREKIQALASCTGLEWVAKMATAPGLWMSVEDVSPSDVMCVLRIDTVAPSDMAQQCLQHLQHTLAGGCRGKGEEGKAGGNGEREEGSCCRRPLSDWRSEERAWVRLRVLSLFMPRFLRTHSPPSSYATSASRSVPHASMARVSKRGAARERQWRVAAQTQQEDEDQQSLDLDRAVLARGLREECARIWEAAGVVANRHLRLLRRKSAES